MNVLLAAKHINQYADDKQELEQGDQILVVTNDESIHEYDSQLEDKHQEVKQSK